MNNLIITSLFIGSQQTQHIAITNGEHDHVRQLIRSKHGSTRRRDNHLAAAMDP